MLQHPIARNVIYASAVTACMFCCFSVPVKIKRETKDVIRETAFDILENYSF